MTEIEFCNRKNCWHNDASQCNLNAIELNKRGKCSYYQHYIKYFRTKLKKDWSDE